VELGKLAHSEVRVSDCRVGKRPTWLGTCVEAQVPPVPFSLALLSLLDVLGYSAVEGFEHEAGSGSGTSTPKVAASIASPMLSELGAEAPLLGS